MAPAFLATANVPLRSLTPWAPPFPPGRRSLAVQLACTAQLLAMNRITCAAPVLTGDGSAAELTHRAFALLDVVHFSLAPPIAAGTAAGAAALSPQAECRTLLGFIQLVCLAAPAVVQAVQESRLWRQHNRERAACSLQPEGGGRFYAGVLELAEALDPLSATVAAWVLLGVLWGAALGVSMALEP